MSDKPNTILPAILPGGTLGILGGGQLGRMLAAVAKRNGYRVWVYTPESNSPASHFADRTVVADYEDVDQLKQFAAQVDVITFEFENVPVEPLRHIEHDTLMRPGLDVFDTVRSRINEKSFLAKNDIRCAPFAVIESVEQLRLAAERIGLPAVLKVSAGGYDGKGQFVIDNISQCQSGWETLGAQPATLEKFVDLACEVSVLVARDCHGQSETFGPIENYHSNHILDYSVVPAAVTSQVQDSAVLISRQVAEKIGLVGLICVEFFVTVQQEVLVNEIAPRPHNSGHLTIEGAVTCQFEQQLNAVCGLPVVPFLLRQPTAMANLLGDIWANGEPHWEWLNRFPQVKLHLYDKFPAKPGRKMGHLTIISDSREQAIDDVLAARDQLAR